MSTDKWGTSKSTNKSLGKTVPSALKLNFKVYTTFNKNLGQTALSA